MERKATTACAPPPPSNSVGDAYARCRAAGSTAGRGSLSGWTRCPLCHSMSVPDCVVDVSIVENMRMWMETEAWRGGGSGKSCRLFSHGRGLSAHLHAVHSPWNPGKVELRRRLALVRRRRGRIVVVIANEERDDRRRRRVGDDDGGGGCDDSKRPRLERCDVDVDRTRRGRLRRGRDDDDHDHDHEAAIGEGGLGGKWEPSDGEVAEWNRRVMEIVSIVGSESSGRGGGGGGMGVVVGGGGIGSDQRRRCDEDGELDDDALPPPNVVVVVDAKDDGVGPGPPPTRSDISSGRRERVDDDANATGRDRAGNVCRAYRESIPPLLAAAADGDLDALRGWVNGVVIGGERGDTTRREQRADDDDGGGSDDRYHAEDASYGISGTGGDDGKRAERAGSLLALRDRNGSTAEHWAAGGGHLDCVAYLLGLRDEVVIATKNANASEDDAEDWTTSDDRRAPPPPGRVVAGGKKRIGRRRDGKTSLHYASRNGHNDVIDLLLSRYDAPNVDVRSGDGTTPLHMACYGGHPATARHLVEKHNADIFAVNEWDCGVAHWTAMSLGREGTERVIDLCEYLKDAGVDFSSRQRQGHAPLHKAAARGNVHVIEWLANASSFTNDARRSMGAVDVGGNLPSDILRSVGGEEEIVSWMKDLGW